MKASKSMVLVMVLCGCTIGPSVSTYEPALSPAGVHAVVTLADKSDFEGELLTAAPNEVTVLKWAEGLTSIPAEIITKIKIDTRRNSIPVREMPLTEAMISLLRPLSRFPAGIPDDVLRDMLARRGQDSIRVLSIE